MTRNLKTLALALVAAFAMSAIAATAAQAENEFTASEYPATIEGALGGKKPHMFQFGIHNVNCQNVQFRNTVKSDSIDMTQTVVLMKNCEWIFMGLKLDAAVTMNGCDWYYPDVTKKANTLTCPKGKVVEIHGLESENGSEEGNAICSFDVAPQSELSTVEFENTEASPEDVLVKESLSGISYTVTGPPLQCGSSGNNGKMSAEKTLTAKNEKEESIGFMIG